jgi:hypothetical protein
MQFRVFIKYETKLAVWKPTPLHIDNFIEGGALILWVVKSEPNEAICIKFFSVATVVV